MIELTKQTSTMYAQLIYPVHAVLTKVIGVLHLNERLGNANAVVVRDLSKAVDNIDVAIFAVRHGDSERAYAKLTKAKKLVFGMKVTIDPQSETLTPDMVHLLDNYLKYSNELLLEIKTNLEGVTSHA